MDPERRTGIVQELQLRLQHEQLRRRELQMLTSGNNTLQTMPQSPQLPNLDNAQQQSEPLRGSLVESLQGGAFGAASLTPTAPANGEVADGQKLLESDQGSQVPEEQTEGETRRSLRLQSKRVLVVPETTTPEVGEEIEAKAAVEASTGTRKQSLPSNYSLVAAKSTSIVEDASQTQEQRSFSSRSVAGSLPRSNEAGASEVPTVELSVAGNSSVRDASSSGANTLDAPPAAFKSLPANLPFRLSRLSAGAPASLPPNPTFPSLQPTPPRTTPPCLQCIMRSLQDSGLLGSCWTAAVIELEEAFAIKNLADAAFVRSGTAADGESLRLPLPTSRSGVASSGENSLSPLSTKGEISKWKALERLCYLRNSLQTCSHRVADS